MYWMKLSMPWCYLTWRPTNLSPEHEVAFTRMTRREGFIYMLRLHWHIIAMETDAGKRYYNLESAWIFLSRNYPPFVCLLGYYVGLDDCVTLALIWLATFVYGTLRYLAWLIALLYRWPPLAKG